MGWEEAQEKVGKVEEQGKEKDEEEEGGRPRKEKGVVFVCMCELYCEPCLALSLVSSLFIVILHCIAKDEQM